MATKSEQFHAEEQRRAQTEEVRSARSKQDTRTKSARPGPSATMNKTRSKRPPSKLPPADNGDAFIPDVARSHTRLIDDDAESYAEEFMAEATSGEHIGEDARDERADDETLAHYVVDFTVLDEDDAIERDR